jgi:hypothetical protein
MFETRQSFASTPTPTLLNHIMGADCGFLFVYSLKEPEVDRHPEKRLKAAFTAFEETNMPRVKSENPTLRMSQLKQILRKEWMRSPENPLNQQITS